MIIFVYKLFIMAKKAAITKDFILSEYTKYILEEGKKPNSIYSFCSQLKIEETQFYAFFSSFEHIEEIVFTHFHEATLNLLEKSEDFATYDAKTKLLSYYFTYFEQLTANRSLTLYLLELDKSKLNSAKKLNSLRKMFIQFIESLGIESIKIPESRIEKIQQRGIAEMSWGQFVMILKFWIDDTSPSFEKTDIFIEKSVHASFDLLDLTPLKNIIDFGKFLWKEKITK